MYSYHTITNHEDCHPADLKMEIHSKWIKHRRILAYRAFRLHRVTLRPNFGWFSKEEFYISSHGELPSQHYENSSSFSSAIPKKIYKMISRLYS